jgi:hypothetical protein
VGAVFLILCTQYFCPVSYFNSKNLGINWGEICICSLERLYFKTRPAGPGRIRGFSALGIFGRLNGIHLMNSCSKRENLIPYGGPLKRMYKNYSQKAFYYLPMEKNFSAKIHPVDFLFSRLSKKPKKIK